LLLLSQVRVEQKSCKVGKGKKKVVEINTISSNYHIEMNPSDVGRNDTHVIQEVIKEMAQTQNVSASGGQNAFKVVVLNEVDKLTHEAQQALRRTMEKYVRSCRIIMCCTSVCRVIDPLQSRCVPVRVPAPSREDIKTVLDNVAHKEKISVPAALIEDICDKCRGNMRKAVLTLESCKVQQFGEDQKARLTDWERFTDDIGNMICEEQSPQRLLAVRHKFYELLKNCIPPDVILKTLLKVLVRRLDDQLKHETVKWAAHYECVMQSGSKPIFHLEAFVAKFMSMYKQWVVSSF
jgi:replication factor C subunit 3/5